MNSEAPGTLTGLDLLVVEDDEDTRELLKILLQSNGANVRAVGSVPEALLAYDDCRPDVLIADIGMPDYNGYTLIGRVRAVDRERRGKMVPAIALTAFATPMDRDTVLSAGFQAHVAKPFEPGALISLVAGLSRPPR